MSDSQILRCAVLLAVLLPSVPADAQGVARVGAAGSPPDAQNRRQAYIDVADSPYLASCGGDAAANQQAVQTAFDANPKAEIVFSGNCAYRLLNEVVLTDPTHQFQGTVCFAGSTSVIFTGGGSPSAPDSALSAGFRMIARVKGHEQSGPVGIRFVNPNVVGPANGVGIYAANGQSLDITGGRLGGEGDIIPRYAIVGENMIRVSITQSTIAQFRNAGIGILSSGNPAVFSGSGSYFNDSWTISHNVFGSDQTGSIAAILDHGSASFPTRIIEGNAVEGRPDNGALQYGYVTRTGSPSLRKNWFESVSYPVRFIIATEQGTLPGVTGAQPGGTYAVSNFPGGYSYGATLEDNETNKARVAFDVSGANGVVEMINNRAQGQEPGSVMIRSEASGANFIIDKTNALIGPGTRLHAPYGQFVSYGGRGELWLGASAKAATAPPNSRSTQVATTEYVDRLMPQGRWLSFTPTLACSRGHALGVTSATGRYQVFGKTAFVSVTATVSDAGTCAGTDTLEIGALPFKAHALATLSGRDQPAGRLAVATISAGGDRIIASRYDGAWPAPSGSTLVVGGTVEIE